MLRRNNINVKFLHNFMSSNTHNKLLKSFMNVLKI